MKQKVLKNSIHKTQDKILRTKISRTAATVWNYFRLTIKVTFLTSNKVFHAKLCQIICNYTQIIFAINDVI